MQRVDRVSFSSGCFSLLVRDTRLEVNPVAHNHPGDLTDVEGEVALRLQIPTYVRGVWVELVGQNKIFNPSLCGTNAAMTTADLFHGLEHHHVDGLHEGRFLSKRLPIED